MRKFSTYKFLIVLLLFAGCAKDLTKKGNEKYDNNFHAEAVPYFIKSLEKKSDLDVMIKLANCYKQLNDFEKAEEWYRKIVSSPESKPVNKLHLAEILRQNNKCSEAQEFYLQYKNEKLPSDRVLCYKNFCDKDSNYISTTSKYIVEPLSAINSGESSYGPAFNKDGIVFLSNMSEPKGLLASKEKNLFYDIYYAKYNNNGFTTPEKLKGKVNTQFHEGPVTFNKTFDEMYFTRSNYYKNNLEVSSDNVNTLKIYSARLINDEWTNIKEFPFNNDKYSVGHPSLSKDGKMLFFTSDMPGGFGGTDIYSCTLVNGQWEKPVNLGSSINTSGNELFPFILASEDSMKLYFSSDGHPGFGGLDIYSADYKNNEWKQTAMLPYPVNSYADDFGMIADDANQYGFFSSNRFNTNGIDKLYRYEVSPLKEKPILLEGVVANKVTKEPIPQASVELIEVKTRKSDHYQTADDGKYKFHVKKNAEYSLVAKKDSFFTETTPISTVGKKEDVPMVQNVITEKIVINKPITLENIYYDLNKYTINSRSAEELEKLVKVMNDNPTIKIMVGSHTDNQGTEEYNQKLSDMRAKEVIKFMIRNGVNQNRLTYKGFGESKLLVNCNECTEEEHAKNRRTEFEVIKVE